VIEAHHGVAILMSGMTMKVMAANTEEVLNMTWVVLAAHHPRRHGEVLTGCKDRTE